MCGCLIYDPHRHLQGDALADYYRTKILVKETCPDRLHDLRAEIDGHQAYTPEQVKDMALNTTRLCGVMMVEG